MLHHFAALFDMGHFASAEHHGDLHFIFVIEKTDRLFHFKVDIVLTGFGAKPNFLELGLMSLVLGRLFAAIVSELSVVHDATYGRLRIGSDLNQIQSIFFGFFKCLFCWNNPELITF